MKPLCLFAVEVVSMRFDFIYFIVNITSCFYVWLLESVYVMKVCFASWKLILLHFFFLVSMLQVRQCQWVSLCFVLSFCTQSSSSASHHNLYIYTVFLNVHQIVKDISWTLVLAMNITKDLVVTYEEGKKSMLTYYSLSKFLWKRQWKGSM